MGDFFSLSKDALPPSFVLNGHYCLEEVVGHGGFGITYAAKDTSLQIRVAIKELYLRRICRRRPDGSVAAQEDYQEQYNENRRSFLEEARVLARLGSRDLPGIVKVREFFEENNTAYIVMDLLDGMTLREYVKVKGGRLKGRQTCMLLSNVAMGMAAMHDEQIIHKDVSPDNIMILKNGEAELLDFGAALRLDQESRPSQLSYRRGYAAPEQYSFDGKLGKYTDVYSLAATIYWCLTGQNPTDAEERRKGKHLPSPTEMGADLDSVTERVLLKAMDLRENRRYSDIREFWSELQECVFSGKAGMSKEKNNNRVGLMRPSVKKTAMGACIASVIACGAFTTVWMTHGQDNISTEQSESYKSDGEELLYVFPEDGYYRLVPAFEGGKPLHTGGESPGEGELFDLHGEEGSSAVFLLTETNRGCSIRYTDASGENLLWLSVLDDSPESGAFLSMRQEDGGDTQYWHFLEDGEGGLFIRSFAGTYLDAEEASRGESVKLASFNGSEFQKWSLVRTVSP